MLLNHFKRTALSSAPRRPKFLQPSALQARPRPFGLRCGILVPSKFTLFPVSALRSPVSHRGSSLVTLLVVFPPSSLLKICSLPCT
jgi:hypothetical protein